MIRVDAAKPVRFCDGLTRRDFLHAGSLSMLGLSLADLFALRAAGAAPADRDVNCVMMFLLGGPSQLDTWDMKPNAPAVSRREPGDSGESGRDGRPMPVSHGSVVNNLLR